MKKILFIIPKLATGGTNSSLDSLYLQLKKRYDVSVFSISHHPISHCYSFCEALLPMDYLLSVIFANFADQKGVNMIVAFIIKVLRSVCRLVGIDIGLERSKLVAKRLEKRNTYDYIVGYQEGNATKLASLFTNPNKIAWLHSDYNRHLPIGKTEESMYSMFKSIVTVSDYTTSVFNKRYPALSDRTLTIHNLIDASRIMRLSKETIEDDCFETSKYTILSVGRFAKVKRFREIPQIAAKLVDFGMTFNWYVLGPEYDSDEVESFKANADSFSVSDYVHWIGGKSNPYPFFAVANLYVCLSESEACPMVFKEAALLSLPIVTTDFPSSFEFVNDHNGVITSLESIPLAIVSMKKKYDAGFRLPLGEDDSQAIVDRVCSLFK